MFALDAISATHFGDGELRIYLSDGSVGLYRIRDGQLECFAGQSHNLWYPLSTEEILQHVLLHTPVATWLYVRLRLKAASESHKQLIQELEGRIMVTDPVCGMEVEEIDVPESLRVEWKRKIYYFCSHECKMEFEQNQQRFVHA